MLDAAQHEAFWHALPGRPADTDGVAAALRTLLDGAIAQANQHPQGAVAALPPAVRALIRRYVHADALRSVTALRAREQQAR